VAGVAFEDAKLFSLVGVVSIGSSFEMYFYLGAKTGERPTSSSTCPKKMINDISVNKINMRRRNNSA